MVAFIPGWEKSAANQISNGGLLISGSKVRVLVRPPKIVEIYQCINCHKLDCGYWPPFLADLMRTPLVQSCDRVSLPTRSFAGLTCAIRGLATPPLSPRRRDAARRLSRHANRSSLPKI